MKPFATSIFATSKILGTAALLSAIGSMAIVEANPAPAPPPRPPQAPQKQPPAPRLPAVKFVVRITKAPGLDVHVANSARSRVVTTLPQGTLLDVRDTDSKGNWLHVTPKGRPGPAGWVPKSHTIRAR